MSNMSYCRFTNTVKDLAECVDTLCEVNGNLSLLENDDERRAARRMYALCEKYISLMDDCDEDD